MLITLGLLAMLLYNAWLIDDWSRDLSQNTAETSPLADDPLLRPMMISLSMDETVELVRSAAAGLARWREEGEPARTEQETTFRLVRTTGLMRYQDDVTVHVLAGVEGSIVRVESKSRIGKGDLGQNPRNIKELLGEVLRRAPEKDRQRLLEIADAAKARE